jgi:hypothetical protein
MLTAMRDPEAWVLDLWRWGWILGIWGRDGGCTYLGTYRIRWTMWCRHEVLRVGCLGLAAWTSSGCGMIRVGDGLRAGVQRRRWQCDSRQNAGIGRATNTTKGKPVRSGRATAIIHRPRRRLMQAHAMQTGGRGHIRSGSTEGFAVNRAGDSPRSRRSCEKQAAL